MEGMKSYVAEFLGTFALVFIGGGVVLINAVTSNTITGGVIGMLGVALAHGLVLMSMIYALGHISGGHFNPAVTIAMFATKRMDIKETVKYIIAQLFGAAIAGFLLGIILFQLPKPLLYGFPTSLPFGVAVLTEAILTFFLVLTVFGTAVDNKAQKGVHGLAIGLVLTFDILFGGSLTGPAMNPARTFGPALVSGVWSTQAVYWIGPIIGGLVAAFIYEYLFLREGKVGKK